MKVHPIWLLVAIVLAISPDLSQASSLRQQYLNATNSTNDDGNDNVGYDTSATSSDGSDASLLNRIVEQLLPAINIAISTLVPDPLSLPLAGTIPLGRLNLGPCRAAADFSYEFGTLTGLSGITVDSLKVVQGTESIQLSNGCLLGNIFGTLWNAVFEIAISSAQSLVTEDLNTGFSATACGMTLGSAVEGGAETFAPTFKGVVNLTGTLLGDTASIDWADFFNGNLAIGYDKVEAWLGKNTQDAFNQFTRQVTGNLSVIMKQELINTVSPQTTPAVAKGLVVQKQNLKLTETLPITLGFRKNAAKASLARAYSSTANFFGFGGYY